MRILTRSGGERRVYADEFELKISLSGGFIHPVFREEVIKKV